MKVSALAYAVILGAALAGPAMAQATRPTDTGNMAYPTPVPQGNIGTTAPRRQAPDTGNMAYPAPVPQGNIGTTNTARTPRQAPDTGNMAYPTPVPQGNAATTRTR